MKTGIETAHRRSAGLALGGLCTLLPALFGGCREFRDDVVGAFETASRSLLFEIADEATVYDTTRDSLADATIDLFFDQFRSEDSR